MFTQPAHYASCWDATLQRAAHIMCMTRVTAAAVPQVDTSGLGVILIDYMVNQEWKQEEEIARDIKVHPKLLRKALKYLERVGG